MGGGLLENGFELQLFTKLGALAEEVKKEFPWDELALTSLLLVSATSFVMELLSPKETWLFWDGPKLHEFEKLIGGVAIEFALSKKIGMLSLIVGINLLSAFSNPDLDKLSPFELFALIQLTTSLNLSYKRPTSK